MNLALGRARADRRTHRSAMYCGRRHAASVEAASTELARGGSRRGSLIDTSHANSGKKPENQPPVATDIARQLSPAKRDHGRHDREQSGLGPARRAAGRAAYIRAEHHDGCIDWDTTVQVLNVLADAVTARRNALRRKLRERSA